jgi:hypothetical protein
MTTVTKTNEVTFFAIKPGQILTMEPEDIEPIPGTRRVRKVPGKRVEFGHAGDPHLFTTSDPETLDFLRGNEEEGIEPHRLYNNPNDGFYELDNPPNAPQPTVKEQIVAISKAAVTSDVEAIRQVVELEKATHNRDQVMVAARGALEGIAEGDEAEEPEPSTSRRSEAKSQT